MDIFVEFFRGFYTREGEKLVKNNIRIINNYITGWFLFDLLTSLPNGVLFSYFCKRAPNKICFSYENNKLMFLLLSIYCHVYIYLLVIIFIQAGYLKMNFKMIHC